MNHPEISRRSLLKMMSSTALLTTLPATFTYGAESAMLSFRKGAQVLPLNFNENSLGMSFKAQMAAKEAVTKLGNRYQVHTVPVLKESLAKQLGIEQSQLLLGHGSTDLIRGAINLAKENNATIIEPDHTFGDVRRYSNARGLKVIKVPMGKDFATDIAALKKVADAQSGYVLVNICNPNNPTGRIVDKGPLKEWLENADDKTFFIADEAYYEYAADHKDYWSAIDLAKGNKENILVTRTFSKIYGMAGMRIGYGVAGEETTKKLSKYATEFYLNAAGVAAAITSLADHEFYKQSVKSNKVAKKILTTALDELSLPHIESHANFLLHKINTPLESYSAKMGENNVLVGRRMTTEDGWNRLSIGTPQQMEDFVKVLKEFRTQGWV